MQAPTVHILDNTFVACYEYATQATVLRLRYINFYFTSTGGYMFLISTHQHTECSIFAILGTLYDPPTQVTIMTTTLHCTCTLQPSCICTQNSTYIMQWCYTSYYEMSLDQDDGSRVTCWHLKRACTWLAIVKTLPLRLLVISKTLRVVYVPGRKWRL